MGRNRTWHCDLSCFSFRQHLGCCSGLFILAENTVDCLRASLQIKWPTGSRIFRETGQETRIGKGSPQKPGKRARSKIGSGDKGIGLNSRPKCRVFLQMNPVIFSWGRIEKFSNSSSQTDWLLRKKIPTSLLESVWLWRKCWKFFRTLARFNARLMIPDFKLAVSSQLPRLDREWRGKLRIRAKSERKIPS